VSSSIAPPKQSEVSVLRERVREHEDLVRALQGGEVDAVIVLNNDDTSIARLLTDEPLYRTLIEALPQGVATVLSDGTIVYANRHLTTLAAPPSGTLLGANLLERVAETDRPHFAAMLQRALTATQESSASFLWASGEAPALVSAIRLPISGSDTVGLIIVDVRDQVARRTAEAASRAKDDLLASVSHELRTPLTSIMGWIQLLEIELASNAHLQPALLNLKNAVMAETKIVEQLLDFAHSERGSLPLKPRECDLCQIVRTAASFVEVQAQRKRLILSVDLPDQPVTVFVDPDRMRQVFLNLLSNAVKFTTAGEVRIDGRLENSFAIVTIKDTGIGIMADFLPQVFEPFRRSERAEGYPGLGIGMAISRRIVEAHSGSIDVSSDGPERGSTFTVRLPLVNA